MTNHRSAQGVKARRIGVLQRARRKPCQSITCDGIVDDVATKKLKIERKEVLSSLTVRVSSEDRRLLAELERVLEGRSQGEVIRYAIKRLAEEAGVK
jgi:hypothetical protein